MVKKIAKVFLVIVGILLLIYIAGVLVFQSVYLPNTKINGKDYSLMPKANFQKEFEKVWQEYDLRISGKGGRIDTIKAKDFSYEEKLNKGEKVVQNFYYWPISSFVAKEYTLKTTTNYDEAKLDELIQKLHIVSDPDIQEPSPAKIGYEEGNGYVVVPATSGDRVDMAKLKPSILKEFSKQSEKLDLEKENLYVMAPETEGVEQMEKHVKSLNEIEAFALSFNFSDRIEPLAGEPLIALYSQNEAGELKPDPEKVALYVKNLAEKFDTFGATRDIPMTGGGTARVKGGIYGWLTDQKKTSQMLLEAMEKKESQELKPIYTREAVSRNINDIGASYIEIDIARQHMWLYKEGQLVVESPVVTGDPLKGNSTPTGTGVVWSMEEGRYLTGDTWKSWVNFWMPFNWSGCGIHDSNWRSSYGGNIYRGGGSHGCVNTPPANARVFYQNSFKGMPVIVYNSYTQKI